MVNGQKRILQVKEGHPIRVISLKNIQSIFIISNPDKINHIPVPEQWITNHILLPRHGDYPPNNTPSGRGTKKTKRNRR